MTDDNDPMRKFNRYYIYLSHREIQCLEYLFTSVEIRKTTFLHTHFSHRTIAYYCRSIMLKLHCNSTMELFNKYYWIIDLPLTKH